ncbi:MAG: hypothetical protein HRT71_17500 [Flavobacteriales bacterium]|nr:hypothetical protein [Flavobacteriales bacterium]
MAKEGIDKFLDKLPYTDGTGRIKFIAGSVVLIGILYMYSEIVPAKIVALAELDLADFISSPSLIAGAILIVYAIGNLVEVFGEYFLIRATAGLLTPYNKLRIKRYEESIPYNLGNSIFAIFPALGNFVLEFRKY